MDRRDMESSRWLLGDLSRLHELLSHADGRPAERNGCKKISRSNSQERQASGLDWQSQTRSRGAQHPGRLEKAAPDFCEFDVRPVSRSRAIRVCRRRLARNAGNSTAHLSDFNEATGYDGGYHGVAAGAAESMARDKRRKCRLSRPH